MDKVSISDDLITEIFSRLPVKSLARFKCLSKFWLSSIEDPCFVEKIRLKAPFKWLFKDVYDDETYRVYSIDRDGSAAHMHSYKFGERLAYFRYCDGLICYFNRDYDLCLYNLTTQAGIQLPGEFLAFELAFDPSSQKYKVLGWTMSDEETDLLDIKILTLENGISWRPVRNTLLLTSLSAAETTVDGRLFWFVYGIIVSFNLASEEFSTIRLPGESGEFDNYSLFGFDGSLALAEQRNGPSFSFWILNDVGGNKVWSAMKRNITLPFEGTTMVDYYYPGTEWRLFDSNFSSRSGEILITASDNEEGCLYLYSYHPLNGEIKLTTITEQPFYNFKIRNYVANYLCLQELV